MEEKAFLLALTGLNLIAGVWGAVCLGRTLRPRRPKLNSKARPFFALLGVYFLECVAFSAGMATQVFVFALAVVWGFLLGMWVPQAPRKSSRRIPLFLGLYTSLPTVSFCALLLIASFLAGRPLLSTQAGLDFGIPPFVPRPFQTMLGFCLVLGVGTLILKCAITTTAALLVLHVRKRRMGQPPAAGDA
jgi:hypothetical protein